MKDHNLDNIKTDYDQIKIPENLKATVEQAIEQGKREQKVGRKKISILAKRMLLLPVAALVVLVILVNANASIAQAFSDIPILNSITKVVLFRTYEDKTKDFEAHIETPQIESMGDASLEADLNGQIAEYTKMIEERYQSDIQEMEGGRKAVESTFDVVTDSANVFSMKIITSEVMASSMTTQQYYTVDKTKGKIIELKDLFQEGSDYISPLSEEIKNQMRREMKEGEKQYFIQGETEMSDGFDKITPNTSFYINPEGKLVISFPEYDVGPGYIGTPEFTIPTETIEGILDANGLIVK